MLAARDQENLVHTHQTTAAGKTLNHAIRALQPKTPGPTKTPFRASKNDENKPLGFNGQTIVGKGGDGKLDKNPFVTPMGPRTRAPLGLKTTNAKAQAFKTPAPPQQTAKPERTVPRPSTGRRSAKSKIIVASVQQIEAEVLNAEHDDDVPEIEYAPPAPIELPDPPIEIEYDDTFPQFQGMNMMRGYGEIYGSPKDEHGKSIRRKEEDVAYERMVKKESQKILKSLDSWPDPLEQAAKGEREVDAMIAAGPKRKNAPDANIGTVKAKSAASALGQAQLPSAATKQTASSIQKKTAAFSVLGSNSVSEPTKSSTMRATAAAAVSKNTIGYPKAAKPRSIIPKFGQKLAPRQKTTPAQVDQWSIHPKDFQKLYGEPPAETDMWFRLREYELLEQKKVEGGQAADDLADDLFDADFFPVEGEDDEDLFQLPMPE